MVKAKILKESTATSRQRAMTCARFCEEKKAEDIVILDVRKQTFVADFFVICSSLNERQSRAIADHCEQSLKKSGERCLGRAGYPFSRWILVDWGDVLVHIFHPDLRRFYDLESLWADAKRVNWQKRNSHSQ